MIVQTSEDPIELKWMCTDATHGPDTKCPERIWYWRFADELHGFWWGPFYDTEEALQDVRDRFRLEITQEGLTRRSELLS